MTYSTKLADSLASSISNLISTNDLNSDSHFKWVSIWNFIYIAFVYSTHTFQFDLFSKLNNETVTIFSFTAIATLCGITYMCVDLFIKQYTGRIDFNKDLSPLLTGVSMSIILNSILWNFIGMVEVTDAARYLITTSFGDKEWSRCHKIHNISDCIVPSELLKQCKMQQRIHFNLTSAHHNYIMQFKNHDQSTIPIRFFASAVLWTLNFCITTVSDTAILKFYKIIFWWTQISAILILIILMISSGNTMQAFLQIMEYNETYEESHATYVMTISEVATVFGIGLIGMYDLGTMSPFTMIDNAVVIFLITFVFFAFIRSMIVRILFLDMSDCVEVDIQMITSHYLKFALLPLSTEFQYCQKVYTIYLYLHVVLTIVSYLTLFTLTMAKLLQIRFRSVKNVYIVGILCVVGFIMTLPVIMVVTRDHYFNGLMSGMFPSLLYLGGLRMAIVMYVYGVKKFSDDISFWLGYKPTRFWTISWTVLPVILLLLNGLSCIDMLFIKDPVRLRFAVSWFGLSVLIVLLCHIKTIASFMLRNNLLGAFICSKKYGPIDAELRALRRRYNTIKYHRECYHSCMVFDEGIVCNHLPLMHTERGKLSLESSNQSLTHLYEGRAARMSSTIFDVGTTNLD